MPALLFEGEYSLKVYPVESKDNTVRIVMFNNLSGCFKVHEEIKLSENDVKHLSEWINAQVILMDKNTNK